MTTGKKVLVWCAAAVGALAIASGAFVLYMRWDEPPPDDADLALEHLQIPESQNAYTYFLAAADNIHWPHDFCTEEYWDTGQPQNRADWLDAMLVGTAWDDSIATELLKENEAALRLLEEGLARPAIAFPIPEDLLYTDLRRPIALHGIERILRVRARHLARQGQAEEAMTETMKLVRLGHRIEEGGGPLSIWLVGMMLKGLGTGDLCRFAAETDVAPEHLSAVARDLSRYTAGREMAKRFLIFDHQEMVRLLEATKQEKMASPPLWGPQPRWLTPVLHLRVNETRRLYAEMMRKAIEDIGKPLSEVAVIQGPADPLRPEALRAFFTPNAWGKNLLSGLASVLQNLRIQMCVAEVDIGATQVVLAMRAFKATEGRLPERLDELVPGFLDAVPTDPFDGKPLRYNPEKKIIYTVGEDLTDSGGTTEAEWLNKKRREYETEGLEWTAEDERIAKESGEMDSWRFQDPSWAIEF